MDIVAAKTFIAIVEGGSFLAAAKRVHVTQSTVSARIKSLEEQLGKTLFIRNKSECALTPAGARFHRYARNIIRAWEEARHQLAAPEGFSETLAIGGQYSLWQRFLLWWLPTFQSASPTTAVRAEIGMPARLMRELAEGALDLAVIYNPELRPGLKVEELMRDDLVLVAAGSEQNWCERYVFIDWGEAFRHWHSANYEDLHNPGLTLDLGALGVNYLLNNGAAGYLPERIAAPHKAAGNLVIIEDAPVFPYPAYVVFQNDYQAPDVMKTAVATLQKVAKKAQQGGLPPPFWA